MKPQDQNLSRTMLVSLLTLSSVLLQLSVKAHDSTKIVYPNSISLYCPVYYSFDRLPIVVTPMVMTEAGTALTAIGISYRRILSPGLSIEPGLEFFDYYSNGFSIEKRNQSPTTDLGSVLSRFHVLTMIKVAYKLYSTRDFSSGIEGGIFMRFGEELIQASPYSPSAIDAIAVGRQYLDPGVNLGFEAEYRLSSSWSLSASLRYDQIVWRKSKGPHRLNPNLPGTSRNFISFTYGLYYSWGKNKNKERPTW